MVARKVAVIGAGPSGLVTVKTCLEEGLEPICFEKSNDIGGLWHYNDKVKEDRTTAMECTVANASKEFTSFSDFPVPKHFPIYMPASLFESYLKLYAERFQLLKFIRLQTEVISVEETMDHESTGQWKVKVKNNSSGYTEDYLVDAVCICNGANNSPFIPDLPGMADFQGKILHVRDHRNSKGFENKRVVVLGNGNSAGDVACDASNVAKEVHLSCRNGAWTLPRQSANGMPLDFLVFTKFISGVQSVLPNRIGDRILTKVCNSRLDHELYGLCPKFPPTRLNVMVNDELPLKLMSGKVKMKPALKHLTGTEVVFEDGSCLKDIDVIVCATGYHCKRPFLCKSIMGGDLEQLYLGIFPRQRYTSTMAAIGYFRTRGPVLPTIELQARYAINVFKGNIDLPSQSQMKRWVDKNIAFSRQKKLRTLKHIHQFDFVQYNDEVAAHIGCKPNLFKTLFTDPLLTWKCLFEPTTSYRYRLTGPRAWSGARDAIMGQYERTFYALTDGRCGRGKQNKSRRILSFLVLFSIAIVAVHVHKVLHS